VKEAVIEIVAETNTDHEIITDHEIVTRARGVIAEDDITTDREINPRNRIKTGGLDTTARIETRAIPDKFNVDMIMTTIETGTAQRTGEETTGIECGTTAGEELHTGTHERNLN
jgi:hypothetical protein